MRSPQSKKRILIVEDDPLFSRMLGYQLSSLGYDCKTLNSGHAFLEYLPTSEFPDMYIFDYFLGHDEPTGLSLCRRIRSLCDVPVMVLTGNDKLETLVSCLKAGADHYIVKPCDIRELEARIISSLRKSATTSEGRRQIMNQSLDDNLTLDWQEQTLRSNNGQQVSLTEKEFGLLELFVTSEDRYVDRNNAFQVLYGYDMDPANRSVDVLISKLRKKLASVDADYRIKPLRGKGYSLFRADSASGPANRRDPA
jgi:DNA-binding response OmpR family regulator